MPSVLLSCNDMKIHVGDRLPMPPRQLVRRLSYGEFVDPRTGEVSYVRRLSNNFYPRFHVYIEKKPDGIWLNLHLDQKQASYSGQTMHSGEYDGEIVEQEGKRILGLLASMPRPLPPLPPA